MTKKEEIEKLKEKLTKVKARHPILRSSRTFGQKASDTLTKWAGSWIFIIVLIAFIIGWVYLESLFILSCGTSGTNYFNEPE